VHFGPFPSVIYAPFRPGRSLPPSALRPFMLVPYAPFLLVPYQVRGRSGNATSERVAATRRYESVVVAAMLHRPSRRSFATARGPAGALRPAPGPDLFPCLFSCRYERSMHALHIAYKSIMLLTNVKQSRHVFRRASSTQSRHGFRRASSTQSRHGFRRASSTQSRHGFRRASLG
jgi:hypothetical protein